MTHTWACNREINKWEQSWRLNGTHGSQTGANYHVMTPDFLGLDTDMKWLCFSLKDGELLPLFIEALWVSLMIEQKIKKCCFAQIFTQIVQIRYFPDNDPGTNLQTRRAVTAQLSNTPLHLRCVHGDECTVQYMHTHTEGSCSQCSHLGMRWSCPERRTTEPGHSRTTAAGTVQVWEESCCSW